MLLWHTAFYPWVKSDWNRKKGNTRTNAVSTACDIPDHPQKQMQLPARKIGFGIDGILYVSISFVSLMSRPMSKIYQIPEIEREKWVLYKKFHKFRAQAGQTLKTYSSRGHWWKAKAKEFAWLTVKRGDELLFDLQKESPTGLMVRLGSRCDWFFWFFSGATNFNGVELCMFCELSSNLFYVKHFYFIIKSFKISRSHANLLKATGMKKQKQHY